MQGLLGQRGVDWMRDEEYCEIMKQAEIVTLLRDYYPTTYEEIMEMIG